MSDDYGVHHDVARELREDRELRDRLAQQAQRGKPGAHFGQGIGAFSGWTVFCGLLGFAIGLFARGLVGGLIGGLLFTGIFMAVGYVARMTMPLWNRGPVIVWFLMGGVSFFLAGGLLHGEGINWAFVGAPLAAAFRYLMKDVKTDRDGFDNAG
ncbi:MAG: hypothetical protein MUF16_06550 [Burkholderiaceae bacterium]|jgi:hypothetical protein|nr:hypothetical protein [Burkholderiaceae bacterium]